jgi:D-amino-acid dehydrogenase
VAVVGGGAIGVCCAYELAQRGASVVLYERSDQLGAGCSAANAGLVCPSHSTPIANPASLRSGLRWLWKRDSPFYLRPRPAVLPWLVRFARAARHPDAAADAIRELAVASLEQHARFGAELVTSFERAGTLNVYATHEGLEAETRAAARSGLPFEVFDADGTRELEPALVGSAAGSVLYPREGRVDPARFVEAIARAASEAGADIRTGVDIRSLDEVEAETVVVAAGAWSRQLVRLPLEAGKGYYVDYERSEEDDPRVPAWLEQTLTVATPLPDRLRLSGTFELAGLDFSPSERRIDAVRSGAERWFRRLRSRRVLATGAGLRPCLPDGLPAIGRLGRVVVATGHAMKGVSLAPVTGRLVAQLVAGEVPEHDLGPFDPNRF